MFKKIVIFMVIVCSLYSHANAIWPFGGSKNEQKIIKKEEKKDEKKTEKQREKDQEKSDKARAKKEIEEISNDEQYYSALASAELKEFNDAIYKTKESACERAKIELAKTIEVRIINTVVDALKGDKKNIEDNFESKTQTYCDQVLEDVKIISYTNYPGKDEITAIAYISKAKYKKTIEDDIKNKKGSVLTPLFEGMKALKLKNYGRALTRFIESRNKLIDIFAEMPLNDDLDNDGKTEEVNGFLSARIGEIIGNIGLRTNDNRIFFDSNGKIRKRPVIYAVYAGEEAKPPVPGILLKANFIKGKGEISKISPTGILGDVEIPIENIDIDPNEKVVVINITIDREKHGLEESLPLPSCRIAGSKTKSVAYSVNFFNSGTKSQPNAIIESLKSNLSAQGYGIIKYDLGSKEVTDETLRTVAKTNVDYFICVTVSASGESIGGGYEGMYKSFISGGASIYSLPDGNLVSQIESVSSKGYGGSITAAGLNALEKVKPPLISKIKEEIQKLP